MITVTIDGKKNQVNEESTILEAAQGLGIYIPTLCYLGHLNPLGSCRVCLVEVEGLEAPVTACNTRVTEGMTVKTQSGNLQELRKRAVQFMLADHPLDCPVCDKAGECRLQDLTYELGIASKEYTLKNDDFRVDYHSPLIERYESRCVRCGRCVSVCQERQGVGAYVYRDKGYQMRIDTVDSGPLDCDFCGQCISACPVGALINKRFKNRCRAWQLQHVPSVCPYCSAGCSINLDVYQNKVQRIRPAQDEDTEVGKICGRPIFGFEFIHSTQRLTTPMIRKQGKLEPVTWEEAFEYTAQQFHEIKQKSGKQAIAGIGSTRTTNEDNYLFQAFMRRDLESPYLDSYNTFGYSAAIAALKEATGRVTPGFTPADIEKADLIMVIGCELPVELPVPSLEVIRAAREGKTRLINALPMGSKLDRYAHLRLRYKPGTEIQLLAGLIKLTIENNQVKYKEALQDQAFVKSLDNISIEKITQATGLDAVQLQEAAGMIARAEITYFIAGHYLISQDNVTQAVQALTNLALLQEAQVFIAPEKNNQFGALAMGLSPDWTIGLNQPAKSFSPVLPALEKGEIKALYLMGADILADYPGGQTLTKALEKIQFLVVQDVFAAKVLEYAHVVLPACTFAEKEGTFIDAWGRVQKIKAAVPPVGNSRPDWQIIAGIAGQMDNETMNYNSAAQITAEIAAKWPGFPENPEYPNQKTHKLYPLALPGETSGETLPYTLLIGPSLFHNGTLSTHAQGLLTLASGSVLEMNPEDMAALKIAAADEVKLISDAITLRVKIKAAPRMPRGVLFLPRHFDSIPAVFTAGKYPLAGVRIERY